MAELPPDIRQLLTLARPALDPHDEDRTRIGRALAQKLAADPAEWIRPPEHMLTPIAASPVAAGPLVALPSKLIMLLSALGVLGLIGGLLFRATPSQPAPEHAPAPITAQPMAADSQAPQASTQTPPSQPVLDAPATAPQAVAAREQSPSSSVTPSSERRRRKAVDSRQRAGATTRHTHVPTYPLAAESRTARAADDRDEAASALPGHDQSAEALAPSAASPSPETPKTPPTRALVPDAPQQQGQLAQELQLIRAASRALDTREAARALELVREHEAGFSRGILTQEREALRIAALCELGRRGEASSLRERFEAQHPRSPLRVRIATHCKP